MHPEISHRAWAQARSLASSTSRHSLAAFTLALAAAAALSLAACGGGGSGDNAPTAPPSPQSLSGVVIDGPIMGATVCLDLNKNGRCDAGEPASGTTGAQGQYTIAGLTPEQVNADAPLIAEVPATAVDADNPSSTVGSAFTLKSPAGKHAVISPVTDMVQAGIAQGMTAAAAEGAVATQLQVSAAHLYDNYVGATTGDGATLAGFAPSMVSALKAGEAVVVAPALSSTPEYWVRQFSLTDTSNYQLRYYLSSNAVDGTGMVKYFDLREGRLNGAAVDSNSLYDTALVATAPGWKSFNGSVTNTSASGSPYVSNWGLGYTYIGTRVDTDVSGKTIAEVVQMAQNTSVNTLSTLVGVNASALTGTMPAGAKVRKTSNTNTSAPVAYRVSDGTVPNAASLAQMVTLFPVPGTPALSNTVGLGRLHAANTNCGVTETCLKEGLRAAFGSNNAVTYYLCDATIGGATAACESVGTGTYGIGTAVDGATPIMSFAGLPSQQSVQTFTRVFVQRNAKVYYGFREKPSSSVQTRLNKVAFEALAAALGITPPSVGDALSVYSGTWAATYAGSDTGNCSNVYIDALGRISGVCVSTGAGGSFNVSGTVSSTGAATFAATGGTSVGATFSGNFTSTAGSGTWSWPSQSSTGTWTAAKQ